MSIINICLFVLAYILIALVVYDILYKVCYKQLDKIYRSELIILSCFWVVLPIIIILFLVIELFDWFFDKYSDFLDKF